MPLIRRVSLTMLTLLASLWAAVLVLLGAVLTARGVPEWLVSSTGISGVSWRLVGTAVVFGGQFVFMFMVADRLFPRASRRPITWACELGIVLSGVVSLIAAFAFSAAQGSA